MQQVVRIIRWRAVKRWGRKQWEWQEIVWKLKLMRCRKMKLGWVRDKREILTSEMRHMLFFFVFPRPILYVEMYKKRTVPFPCPLVLFLYSVAWWVNATPLQLPPTPSPPRPIHPALQPTLLTHSDVNFCCWGGVSDSTTHGVLPTPLPPPPRVFAGFLLLALLLHSSLPFFILLRSCDVSEKFCSNRGLRKCYNSVTPPRPLQTSPLSIYRSLYIPPLLLLFPPPNFYPP